MEMVKANRQTLKALHYNYTACFALGWHDQKFKLLLSFKYEFGQLKWRFKSDFIDKNWGS